MDLRKVCTTDSIHQRNFCWPGEANWSILKRRTTIILSTGGPGELTTLPQTPYLQVGGKEGCGPLPKNPMLDLGHSGLYSPLVFSGTPSFVFFLKKHPRGGENLQLGRQ